MYQSPLDLIPKPTSAFRVPTMEERLRRMYGGTQQPSSSTPQLSDEETSGILDNVLSGVTWVGEMLDKPGRAVRGTISGLTGGDWGGGLSNLIPFSDTLGITDSKDAVYGRDLLERAGAPKNKPGFFNDPLDSFFDVAGFATEVVTDPLSYVGGPMSALTKAGKESSKAAKLAGKAAEKVASWGDAISHWDDLVAGTAKSGRTLGTSQLAYVDEIREGLRGVASIGIPGTHYRKVFGAGSQRAADLMELALLNKLSPVPHFRHLFSKVVGGVHTALAPFHERTFADVQNLSGAAADAMSLYRENAQRLSDVFADIKQSMGEAGDAIGAVEFDTLERELSERITQAGSSLDENVAAVRQMVRNRLGDANIDADKLEEFSQGMFKNLDGARRFSNRITDHVRDLGGNVEHFAKDMQEHMSRRPSAETLKKLDKVGAADYMLGRKDAIADMPGGTITVHRASRDGMIVGTAGIKEAERNHMAQLLYSFVDSYDLELGTEESIKRLGKFREKLGRLSKRWADSEETLGKGFADSVESGKYIDGMDKIRQKTLKVSDQEFKELQKHYTYAKYIDPQVRSMMERGDISLEDADQYYKWFFDGLDEGEEFMGRIMQEKTKAVGDTFVGYMRELPQDIVESGLFDRKAVDDWADSIEYMAVAGANLSTARSVMRKTAMLPGPDDMLNAKRPGIPLGQAFNSMMNRKGRPLMSNRGRYTWLRDYMDEVWKTDPAMAKQIGLPQAEELLNGPAIKEALEKTWAKHPREAAKAGLMRPEELPDMLSRAIPYDVDQGREIYDAAYRKIASVWEETPGAAGKLGLAKPQELYNAKAIKRAEDMIHVDEHMTDVLNNYTTMTDKRIQSSLGKAFDSYTLMWKGAMTLIAPAYYTRNAIDSAWRGFMRAGEDTYTPAQFAKNLGQVAYDLVRKKGKISKMEFGRDWMSYNDVSPFLGEMGADVGAAAGRAAKVDSLDDVIKPWKDAANTRTWSEVKDHLNLFNAQGVRDPEKVGPQNILFQAGQKVNDFIEQINRFATYKSLRENNMTDSQAKWLTDNIHYNYGKLKGGAVQGNFADKVAKRIVPFWSFVQNNVPYQLGQLMNYPGGGHAQTLRLMNVAQHDSEGKGYVPSWVKETAAIRTGGTDEEATYLRRFGLSMEDPLSMLQFKGGLPNIHRTASRTLSQTHPLITMATKMYTGEDPYSGRKIKNMRSYTDEISKATGVGGRSDLVDMAFAASPGSRAMNVMDSLLFSPKPTMAKALDFATGMKFSTYDAEQAKLTDLSNQINEKLESDSMARFFKVPYAKDEADDETVRAVQLSRIVNRMRKQLTKKREAEGKE